MKSLFTFLNSSIGKKIVMSLTGLFLCTFLAEHVLGNLLLFNGDNGALYDSYTEFMSHNIVIGIIEYVLAASLLGHSISGVIVWVKNRRSRPQNYKVYKLQENTPLASRITMLTGSFILLFLIVHLRTFFVPTRLGTENVSPYKLVVEAFSNQWYSVFYLVALILLSYHLRHGFQSAFQTLGLKNTKYSSLLDVIAIIVWLLIPLGFASIPIYFGFFYKAGPAAMVLGVQ